TREIRNRGPGKRAGSLACPTAKSAIRTTRTIQILIRIRAALPPVRTSRETKKSPGRAGARGDETSRGRTLDAPILYDGTNQARRGSRKRPDLAICIARRVRRK